MRGVRWVESFSAVVRGMKGLAESYRRKRG